MQLKKIELIRILATHYKDTCLNTKCVKLNLS